MKAAWVGAGSRYKIPLLPLRTDIIVEKSRCNNKVSRIIRIPFSIRFILSRIRHGSHLRGRKWMKLRETSSSCVSLPLLSETEWSEEREPTSMHKLSAAVRSGPSPSLSPNSFNHPCSRFSTLIQKKLGDFSFKSCR